MTTRSDLARELGVSKETVRKYAILAGISLPPHTPKHLNMDEQNAIREAITIGSGSGRSTGTSCPICKEKGHSAATCPSSTELKRCNICNKLKPRASFAVVAQSGRDGRRLHGTCRECDSKRLSARYSTLEGRAKAILTSAKARADVFLTVHDVLDMYDAQGGKCYYSGAVMTPEKGFYGFSLDRKNNEDRTYSKENTVLCCWGVNQMKRDIDFELFVSLCKAIGYRHG